MKDRQELDAIVNEVVAEAQISRSLLLPEEIDYFRDHVLKKPLACFTFWPWAWASSLSGEYFGWNIGLVVGGPLGVLIASLIVCVLHLTWVLTPEWHRTARRRKLSGAEREHQKQGEWESKSSAPTPQNTACCLGA